MVNGTGNYILLAVPFFIFTGLIMERGGISLPLVRFVETVVGHLRGGLLQVSVVSMYIVSGLSGSKPADVAESAPLCVSAERSPWSAEGAAVLAASAIMGETVPPSIAMLIVGWITQLSMAALFVGGIIPAAVMAFPDGSYLWPCTPRGDAVRAACSSRIDVAGGHHRGAGADDAGDPAGGHPGWNRHSHGGRDLCRSLRPCSSHGRICAMSWQTLLHTVLDTASLTGMLLFIFAASGGFSWSLTVAYVPQRLSQLAPGHAEQREYLHGRSILLLFGAGVLLEGLPSLNVLAPLLLPIAAKIGVSELHYALVLIIAMGIGGFMPLAGVGFYVCCAIMQTGIEEASRAMVPYLIVIFIGLLIVAFVPWFTLFLPHYFGFGQ